MREDHGMSGQPPDAQPLRAELQVLDWGEVREPGCYLHVATGLLARVRAPHVDDRPEESSIQPGGRVVRLSSSPETPLATLRRIAAGARYRVNF